MKDRSFFNTYLEMIPLIKVECTNEKYIGDGEFEKCDYILLKPKWEHIVNSLYKQGGHAGKNICPKCNKKKLIFNFGDDSMGK